MLVQIFNWLYPISESNFWVNVIASVVLEVYKEGSALPGSMVRFHSSALQSALTIPIPLLKTFRFSEARTSSDVFWLPARTHAYMVS